jgi:hypothetical protein
MEALRASSELLCKEKFILDNCFHLLLKVGDERQHSCNIPVVHSNYYIFKFFIKGYFEKICNRFFELLSQCAFLALRSFFAVARTPSTTFLSFSSIARSLVFSSLTRGTEMPGGVLGFVTSDSTTP